MHIPQTISLSGTSIPVFIPLTVILFLISAFVTWREGKKDGFDEYKNFDLLFLSIFFTLLVSFLFAKVTFLNSIDVIFGSNIKFSLIGVPFGYLTSVYFIAKRLKWSFYRILDIHVLSYSVFLGSLFFLGMIVYNEIVLILPAVMYIFYFVLARKYKVMGITSGYLFASFCVLSSVMGFLFVKELNNLIFIISSNTMGLVVILLRQFTTPVMGRKRLLFKRKRKTKMPVNKDTSKTNQRPDFINSVKNILKAKEKKLKADQKLLNAEDPYLQSGRSQDNASTFDDAILEDKRKEEVDLQTSLISTAQLSIKRALAKLKVGKYGLCEVCGKPIEPQRLKAFPEATTCMEHMK